METAAELLIDWGYWGLFVAAFVAGSILPFSSEAVMVVLVRMGLDPIGCLLAATAGNTLGGMTCYWIGTAGKQEWIGRYLRISDSRLQQAQRFLGGRGAMMAFFAFLPYVGGALVIVLGLMRSNVWITLAAMFAGKLLRYIILLFALGGIVSLF